MDMKKKLREFFTLKRHANDGFTLVELIVVIAIVAILGGVAVPAYTGYIEKADAAADAQIIADINKAFAAACMVEGIDNYNASGAKANIGEDMKVASVEVNGVEEFDAIFDSFFDNEGEFKNEDIKLFYNNLIGGFAELPSVYYTLLDYISDADLAKLNSSTFITAKGLGIEGLLAKVNDVTGFAALISDSEAMKSVLDSNGFHQAAMKALGITDPKELNTVLGELTTQMMAANPGMTQKDAEAKVKANAAVLFAAQSTANMTASEAKALLQTENLKGTIKGNLTTVNKEGTGLSQAALAYGIYTAYAYETGDQKLISDTSDPLKIMNGLNEDGFQTWISEKSDKDIEGYLAAMNMINSCTNGNNADAVKDLMVNGFDNSALAGTFNSALSG